jgi:hypothetical protein
LEAGSWKLGIRGWSLDDSGTTLPINKELILIFIKQKADHMILNILSVNKTLRARS